MLKYVVAVGRKYDYIDVYSPIVFIVSNLVPEFVDLRGCAKTWVLVVLALGVGSCYEDSAGGVIVGVGEPVGDAS